MPRKSKRRRKLDDDSYEEYIDYVFPADDRQTQNLSRMLAMAQNWKEAGGNLGGGAAANGDADGNGNGDA